MIIKIEEEKYTLSSHIYHYQSFICLQIIKISSLKE